MKADKKFVNCVRRNRRFENKSIIKYPTEILVDLEVIEKVPLPFEYGKRYYINGMEFD